MRSMKTETTACSQSVAESSSKVPFLVGKRVRHFFNSESGEWEAGEGKVISTVPGYPEWFNIKYVQDPAMNTYQLLEDMERGDLERMDQDDLDVLTGELFQKDLTRLTSMPLWF